MKNRLEYLNRFMSENGYPGDGAKSLISDYRKLSECEQAAEIFERHMRTYERSDNVDGEAFLSESDRIAELSGVHKYSAEFLFYLCATEHMDELYRRRGLPHSLFLDSADDLRIKLLECHNVYGIWGSFVAFWFPGFFNLTRFALGRLQFEADLYCGKTVIVECGDGFDKGERPYNKNGIRLIGGQTQVLNVHIPSGSKLPYDLVIDSYKKAYGFYSDVFNGGPIVLQCCSWLMYPPMRDFLPKESNLIKFISDFDTVCSWEDPDFHDCWRLFGCDYSGDPSVLPRNTVMQRRYADWLSGGGKPGLGIAVLVFDGENVLTGSGSIL